MRLYCLAALLAAASLLSPDQAHASVTLALSVGSGWEVSPDSERVATNVMLAPGVELLGDIVRAEVGLLADLGDVRERDFDLQVRPMLLFDPPLLPLYGRLTLGLAGLVDGPLVMTFGGSVGAELSVRNVSLFGEVGYVPRGDGDGLESILEGRAGVGVTF